jgi:uncharacterized protein YciI
MYIIVLTYVRPIEEVDKHLAEHARWIREGLADGVFIACGRRSSLTGGVIVARGESLPTLQARLARDPFQRLGLATCEIVEFDAAITIDALRPRG